MKLTQIFKCSVDEACDIPLFEMKIPAGAPTPIDGYMCNRMDLNKHLIKNPQSTFFVQVTGQSMIDAGIGENDLLVIDKNIEATTNKVVIAVVNNEFTVKRLKLIDNVAFLVPENKDFSPIRLEEGSYIWGVVTSVIKQL
ncbi:MAG: translesion error-prone DNA polymerase V autoproteolytic subunit [Rickettsiaceae bacterium]|nr:MAG: translesion error-prone DNA polymerase V autoproteolytic subunit [Rickettsiaceae bacterium]